MCPYFFSAATANPAAEKKYIHKDIYIYICKTFFNYLHP